MSNLQPNYEADHNYYLSEDDSILEEELEINEEDDD